MPENPLNERESKQAAVRDDNLTADHEDLTSDHGDKHVSEKSDLIDVSFVSILKYQAQYSSHLQ